MQSFLRQKKINAVEFMVLNQETWYERGRERNSQCGRNQSNSHRFGTSGRCLWTPITPS